MSQDTTSGGQPVQRPLYLVLGTERDRREFVRQTGVANSDVVTQWAGGHRLRGINRPIVVCERRVPFRGRDVWMAYDLALQANHSRGFETEFIREVAGGWSL